MAAAVPAKDFTVGETGTPILDEDLSQPGLSRNRDDPETCEWLAAVRWIQTVAVSEAYTIARDLREPERSCVDSATRQRWRFWQTSSDPPPSDG